MTSTSLLLLRFIFFVFYTYNAVGSVIAYTNDQAKAIKINDFDAYGAVVREQDLNGQTSRNNRLFSTKERDESTGLDNFGFRYYDSELGRFITRDPSGYPDGANNFVYLNNNPINKIDPLGLQAELPYPSVSLPSIKLPDVKPIAVTSVQLSKITSSGSTLLRVASAGAAHTTGAMTRLNKQVSAMVKSGELTETEARGFVTYVHAKMTATKETDKSFWTRTASDYLEVPYQERRAFVDSEVEKLKDGRTVVSETQKEVLIEEFAETEAERQLILKAKSKKKKQKLVETSDEGATSAGGAGGNGNGNGYNNGGGKNSKHKNQKQKAEAKKKYDEVKEAYEELKSKPNKTKADKKQLEKLKKQRDHLKKKADDNGENHSQKAKT